MSGNGVVVVTLMFVVKSFGLLLSDHKAVIKSFCVNGRHKLSDTVHGKFWWESILVNKILVNRLMDKILVNELHI